MEILETINKTKNMLQKLTNFIKYHNAMAIAVSLVLVLSFTAMASEDVRNTVIGEKIETVEGIDNSQLLAASLDSFDLKMTIINVVQDSQNYYIDYQFKTLAIKDNIWQSVLKSKRLTVSKAFLADSDLGLHVQEEIGEVADYELSYLKEVQDIQKREGKTEIVKTTEYTGLIGLVLDVKDKILPGYEPVVKPPVLEIAQVSEPIIELIEQSLTEQLPDEQFTVSQEEPVQEQSISADSEVVVNPSAPPNTIIDIHPLEISSSTEAIFTFHSTKPNSQFTCKIDAEFWQGCESPITYTDLFIGNHQFQVQAIDSSNQEDPMPAMFEWQIVETITTEQISATTTQDIITTEDIIIQPISTSTNSTTSLQTEEIIDSTSTEQIVDASSTDEVITTTSTDTIASSTDNI